MNKDNEKLLKRYEMICKNKGLTKESLKAIINNDLTLFLRYIKDKALGEVTHINIEDFLFHCREIRGNGDASIARKYTSINMFYNTLIRKDYLDCKNPVYKVDKIKVRKKLRGHLNEEEIKTILCFLEEKRDLRGLALFSLFYSSGCRLSEIHQLNRKSLDFERKQFKVKGKGQKERPCIFSDYAKRNILNYLNSRKDNFESLFISRQNNRWSKKAIQDYVKITAKRAGISKNTFPHLIRHSIATNLLKSGHALEHIQLLLGHESISTTQTYAKQNLNEVQNKFESFYNK